MLKQILVIPCVMLISCLCGCAFFPESSYKEFAPPAVQDAVHLQYATEKAKLMDISDIKEFSGEFVYSYYKSYNINSLRAEGFSTKLTVNVSDGEEVSENKLLFQFSTTEIDEEIAHINVNILDLENQINTVSEQTEKNLILARIDEAKATLNALSEKKESFSFYAPFSGKIRINYTNPQNEAEKSAKEIILYREDGVSLSIDAEKYQKTLFEGEIGEIVRIEGENLSGKGTVRRVPILTANGYSQNDKCYLIDTDAPFSYGDKATFTVVNDTHKNAVCIPVRALNQYKSDDYFVKILDTDGITRREVLVQVGIINSDYVEILSGISSGDTVILG